MSSTNEPTNRWRWFPGLGLHRVYIIRDVSWAVHSDMIDLPLLVSTIVIVHVLGLVALVSSLFSLSHGPVWLLSWIKRNKKGKDVVNKWNVADPEQDLDEQKSKSRMDHKLTFSSLGCTYRSKKGDTVVLQGVCGQITSGGM